MCINWRKPLNFIFGIEHPDPQDWVHLEEIESEDEEDCWINIDLKPLAERLGLNRNPKVWPCPISNSGSMEPIFDNAHTILYIKGENASDHQILVDRLIIGDDAVYRNSKGKLIIHRISDIKSDSNGTYYKFRGFNVGYDDPDKVRPEFIEWVSIGIIY